MIMLGTRIALRLVTTQNAVNLSVGESVMQDNQLDTLPPADNLPIARGVLLAAAISGFFWLIIGAVLLIFI